MTRAGGAREKNGRFYANARFGAGKRIEVRVPWAKTKAEAAERAELLAGVLEQLVSMGRRDLVKKVAKDFAEASTPARLARLQKAFAAMLKGAIVGPSHDITFEQWATRYTSGELARLYPDQVKVRDHGDDVSRLKAYILKLVGDVPVVQFDFGHAQLVMSKLPVMSEANRRQVAQIMGRLMHLAVNPGRLIKASPLPRGWLPKVTKRRHFSCLYPGEEAQLLAHESTPEVFRLFCGILDREGMRLSMLLDSEWWQWGDVGTFTQTKTKTNDPHLVAVRPDTAEAMREWRRRQKAAGRAHEKPFAGVLELVGDRTKIAEYYRAALLAAGVERAELHTSTEFTGALRAHDMRATFVTISLAEGKSETWIRDRTSHKSTAMIDRYRRLSRQFATLELGSLVDLVDALGWRKGGGNEAEVITPPTDLSVENVDGRGLEPLRVATAEPKFGRASEPSQEGPETRRKATSRGAAKEASTSLPPPVSRSLARSTAEQDGSQSVARGPLERAEVALVSTRHGVAALSVDIDILDQQIARLVGGDRGAR